MKIKRISSGGLALTVILFVLLFTVSYLVIDRAEDRIILRQAEQLEQSIRSAAVNAYAVTGCYPTIEEIQQDYGVIIDRESFTVNYSAFASNVMPYISVSVRK